MDYLDDFVCKCQSDEVYPWDEAYPWGDIAPFDWPEDEFEPGRYCWDEMEANP